MGNGFNRYKTAENFPRKMTHRLAWYVCGFISCFIIGALWVYFFLLPGFENQNFKNRYPFLEPGRTLLEEKDLIVNLQPLREKLLAYEEHPSFKISIYFEYLPTGANVSANKDLALWPASLLKIPVAMAVMKKIQRGEWKLGNELVLLNSDVHPEFGTLFNKPVGTRFTIEELLRYTLVESDNTAYFILLRNVEEADLSNTYDHLGFDEELRKQETGRMTAKKYSIFFRSLYNATFLSPEYSEKFLDILKTDGVIEYLRHGIPEGIPFANKTGIQVEKEAFADSGIVYVPGRPYILTVMLQNISSKNPQEDAKKLMGEISREVYGYISNYKEK